jgi:hypothetical protein
MRPPRVDAHGVGIFLHQQAIAVVLNLMNPERPHRNSMSVGLETRLDKARAGTTRDGANIGAVWLHARSVCCSCALAATDEEIWELALVGVSEHDAAIAADVVGAMLACHDDRGRGDDRPDRRCVHHFKRFRLSIAHDTLSRV